MSNRVMKDSGVEWIGEIQENWKVLKGKHIFKLQNGYAFKSELFDNTDGFPLIRIRDITSGEIKTFYKGEVLDDYIVTSGDVLIGMDGDFNVRIWNNQDALLNQRCCRLIEYDNFNKNFIAYACPYPLKVINDTIHATTVKHLSTTDLFNSDFAIPPLHEQQAIATYLDEQVSRLDQLIEDQQQVIEDWKAYKQSLITETVSKGLNPEVDMKDSGIEWIGEIPKHWEVKKIKNVFEIFGRIGFRGYTSNDLVSEGEGAITLGPGNIVDQKFDLNKKTYLSMVKYEESPEIKVFSGDIIFVKTASVGKVAIVPETDELLTINPQFVVLKKHKCNSKFGYYYLISDSFQHQIKSILQHNVVASINQTQLKEKVFSFPPLHEQQQIADFLDEKCSKIDQLIEDKQRLIEDLKTYKQSLIYECVTGKKEIV